jgi:hypothetical protein
MYAAWTPPSCFAFAERYAALRSRSVPGVRDGDTPPDRGFPWSERHLRCVWFDPAYRPIPLVTYDGQIVMVEDPGRWNLEAGPDFLDAVLKLSPGDRRMRGDIELHVRPADWRHHGHAGDLRYNRVIAHVTYFDGILLQADLPPGTLQLSLQSALKHYPSFSFDSLDILAYPYARVHSKPPCADILATWNPEDQGGLLDAAGMERLRRKTDRMGPAVREKGSEQALYEEILGALGYKNNREACRTLAVRLPVDVLRHEAGGDVLSAYALLCGVAGLLPARSLPGWDHETRLFVRRLWDIWWKKQSSWEEQILPRDLWTLSNLRPQNHPLRRLMAAAEWFVGAIPLPQRLKEVAGTSQPPLRTLMKVLEETGKASHWAWRHSLSSPRLGTPLALIGPGRAAALLNNAIAPWLAVMYPDSPGTNALLSGLPPEEDNRLVRHTAHALFGHDHNPSLYRSGLRQQGILQLFHDFCLNTQGGCQSCTLPAALIHQKK